MSNSGTSPLSAISAFRPALRVSYDGSHGTDLSVTTNPDQVPANTVGFAKASANAPYPLWDSLVNVENSGRSNYESLTVSVNKRMSKGLQFQFSYNHAKNLSNAGGYNPTSFVGEGGGQTSDFYNPNLDYGHVPFTRNHRVIANFLYETSSHSQQSVRESSGRWMGSGWPASVPDRTVSDGDRARHRSIGNQFRQLV